MQDERDEAVKKAKKDLLNREADFLVDEFKIVKETIKTLEDEFDVDKGLLEQSDKFKAARDKALNAGIIQVSNFSRALFENREEISELNKEIDRYATGSVDFKKQKIKEAKELAKQLKKLSINELKEKISINEIALSDEKALNQKSLENGTTINEEKIKLLETNFNMSKAIVEKKRDSAKEELGKEGSDLVKRQNIHSEANQKLIKLQQKYYSDLAALEADNKIVSKKISPFKTPKELDIDIKNADNAIIQYEKKIEDARLKEEFNDKMSTAKTEEEKEKIRRTYQKDRLLNQIKAEKLVLELKKKTEIENVKLKTSSHKADLKRIYDKYIFELSLNKKLSDEEKKKLKDEATGKFGIANIQATGEENISIQEITDKYTPLFSLFQKLSDARLSALFSMPSKEGKKDDKTEEYDLEAGLNSYMELQQGLTNFMDGEFSRQITLEQNKTNAINNELRERLNNENLSAGERKNIQLQIARNDEALRKKQEKIEKKRFRMQKAANISQALIETYLAAAKALKTFGGVPTGLPAMSATIATGLLNVATIARQKFQSSAGATVPAGALGGGGSGGADRSFNFNLAGASQENQLAQTLQSQFNQPIQTYVVSRDITNQQQLDQDILSNASFG